MEEIWVDVNSWEGTYQVSSLGNVRNCITNHILIGDKNSLGYRRVMFYSKDANRKERHFVHRLVAFHFCPGYSADKVVNHKDGNKQNNCANNLEWVTRSENDLHAFRHQLRTVNIPKSKFIICTRNLETNQIVDFYQDRGYAEFSSDQNISLWQTKQLNSNSIFFSPKYQEYLKYEIVLRKDIHKPIVFF